MGTVAPLTRSSCQGGRAAAPARRLLEEVVRDCGAQEATVWLISADGTSLDGTFNQGRTREMLEAMTVPLGGTVVGMVAATGQPVSIGPDDPHHPMVDEAVGTTTLAMIAAPVYVDSKLVGVLSAINPVSARDDRFGAASLETLSWKAYLMGLVLRGED